MKLSTLENGSPDGQLVTVSTDGLRFLDAANVAPTLQVALENWTQCFPALAVLSQRLDAGQGELLSGKQFCAPLPRSWQWLDGSAYESHGELMQIAFGLDPIPTDRPLMYQGLSDKFYGPADNVQMTDEALGIDFEGEFGVIVSAVPMGVTAEAAMAHIKLIVQINDWSLRTLAPVEMKTGFGWVQAKPACSVAPFAVTPDELGDDWRNGRVCLDLAVDWNGKRFGNANGEPMSFGFHELVAHAARTRSLPAGTIIGSGTVSNPNYRDIGSSCIAERRAIELVDDGAPSTPFLRFGDTIRMEARTRDGATLFGAIDQKVVKV
jgi:fumarylacetoacetate (FAA) hydrolase